MSRIAMMGMGLAVIVAAAAAQPPSGALPDKYSQDLVLTFDGEREAAAAQVTLAPLYNGYERAVSSRWDDNCANDLEMMKRLDAHGAKATWYLNVDPFENYPGAREFLPVARQLVQNGHTVGGHSASHPYISYVHRNRAFQEMASTRVIWEALLDTPMVSYTFSYVDLGSTAAGGIPQAELIEMLKRAGFYHVAEFKTADELLPPNMILSVIMPPENSDFDTFKKAVDWAMTSPELKERFPGFSHSMHAWYGTARNPYGWEELERRLEYVAAFPDLWQCSQNQYAAYRAQYLNGSLEGVERSGRTLRFRLTRPVVRTLNDSIPLTVAVTHTGRIAVTCDTAETQVASRRLTTGTLINVSHNRDQRLPSKIAHIENPDNHSDLRDTDGDADYPGLRVLLSKRDARLRLRIHNDTGEALRATSVTWRLPLQYGNDTVVDHVNEIAPGENWERDWMPATTTSEAPYVYGPAYLVAQLDFVRGDEAGRIYATCVLAGESAPSLPKDGFAVLGPIDPTQFDLDAFDRAVKSNTAQGTWRLKNGNTLNWRRNDKEGPVDQSYLNPEVVRTTGSWYQLESPLYVLRSIVHSPREQAVGVECNRDDVRSVYLNGVAMREFSGALRAGANELTLVYHHAAAGGSPCHAGCFLRLSNPDTKTRLADLRYAAPAGTTEADGEPDTLKVALLQMLPQSNDQAANRSKADAFCRKPAAAGADIALFPEMFNIGYTPFQGVDQQTVQAWQAQAVAEDGDYVNHFRALARELDMAIGVTYLQTWPGAPRNALSLIDRHGNTSFTYAKVHTCDFAAFEASTTPGDEFRVATLDTRRGPVEVGAMICFDREFPESARVLMLKGAEVVLTPNACLLDDTRLHQFQARALDNSMAVFMTNYPAPLHGGRSVAYGPNGETLAEADNCEGITLASVRIGSLREYRRKTIWGNAFRRPQRYGAITDMSVAPLWERQNGLGQPFRREER